MTASTACSFRCVGALGATDSDEVASAPRRSTTTMLAPLVLLLSAYTPLRTPPPLTERIHASAARHIAGAAAALAVTLSPLSAAAVGELQLADFGDSAIVSEGLKTAGMNGDLRMIKLWARLKAGDLQAEGQKAADKVSDEKVLANARMRVRSVSPYLEEAQGDIFAGRWKFVQGYLGVVFSQRDAFQTIVTDTYPGSDPVSLASKDALVNEGNNIIKYAEQLASAAKTRSEARALSAFAKLSLSYDRFLKAGDLYGNALLLPEGKRPAKPKVVPASPPADGPDVAAAQRAAKAAEAKQDAAELAADRAAADVAAKEAAAKKAAAAERVAVKAADQAEAESEKADVIAAKAAEQKTLAKELAAKEAAAAKETAAKEAAAAKEAVEQKAEAAEAQAQAEAAEKRRALAEAEAKLRALEAKEAQAETNVRLYEKALEFEEKQERAARILAQQKDATSALVPQYDPLTSTEPLYKDTPQAALQYSTVKPKLKDAIVVIAGPDKGRVGVLLGTEKDSSIIKLSTKELKVIDSDKIAKQL